MLNDSDKVENAFVSGSLGQAVFFHNGRYSVLDAHDAEPRDARPNEVYMFRHAARELIPADPEGASVELGRVRAILEEEVTFFKGLNGLLIGMDPDISLETRSHEISQANRILAENEKIRKRIEQRFWRPVDLSEWDPDVGVELAREGNAVYAEACYRPHEEGVIDRIMEDIEIVASERYGAGVESAAYQSALSKHIPALVARIQSNDIYQISLNLFVNIERKDDVDIDDFEFSSDIKGEENWSEIFGENWQEVPQKPRTISIGSMGLQF